MNHSPAWRTVHALCEKRVWRALLRAGMTGLALACWLGCAAYHHGRGDRAAARGDWDTAFAGYAAANARDPQNAELAQKLSNARREAARVHRETGLQAEQQGRLAQAVEELEASLRYEEDALIRERFERVREAKQREDAADAVVDAAVLERQGNLDEALQAYDRALSLNPELAGGVEPRRAALRARLERAADIASQAQTQLERGELEEAERIADEALQIHPKEATAREVLQAVRAERDAEVAEVEARDAERERDYEIAVERARAAQAARASESRRRLVERLEERAFADFRRRSERAYDRGEYADAIHFIELAREFGPDEEALQDELTDAKYRRFFQLGERAERSRDPKAALRHFRDAHELRPSNALAERILKLEQSLLSPRPQPRTSGFAPAAPAAGGAR
jgi:tetratricopeptide (TPR) repeat protein